MEDEAIWLTRAGLDRLTHGNLYGSGSGACHLCCQTRGFAIQMIYDMYLRMSYWNFVCWLALNWYVILTQSILMKPLVLPSTQILWLMVRAVRSVRDPTISQRQLGQRPPLPVYTIPLVSRGGSNRLKPYTLISTTHSGRKRV